MAAKPGTIITDAEGTQWRATQGGNWRAENGKNKGKLYTGKGDPVAAGAGQAAAAAAPQGTVGLNTAPPASFSPAASEVLNIAKSELAKQVQSGAIPQLSADLEIARQQKELEGLSPALQQKKLDLQKQVLTGQISWDQAQSALYDTQTNENRTAPQLTAPITADTSGQEIVNTTFDVAKGASQAGNVLSNPNEVTDFGSKTITVDPASGQPTVTSSLSPENKAVLGGVQGSAVNASDVLNRLISGGTYNQFLQAAGPQSGYSDPALEEAVFSRLTRGFDDEKRRGQEQVAQTLANRGIPIGSEAYSNVMKDFEKTWGDRYDSARENATIQGTNTALQRQSNNIGGLGTIGSGFTQLGALGQAGLYQPNFQAFNSVPYQQPDVQGIFGALIDKSLTEKGFEVQKQLQDDQQGFQKGLVKSAGGGGGGGGGTATKPAPFASAPPGS